MPQINENARRIRKSMNLSQSQLAARAGVSLRTIQFGESGRNVSPETVRLIASALNTSWKDLIDPADKEVTEIDHRTDKDSFLNWPWSLINPIKNRLSPDEFSYCMDKSDALTAVQRMRDSWKYHLKANEPSCGNDTYALADNLLNKQIERYRERYLAIWEQNPTTLLYSSSAKGRNGVSVVLPVSDQAYEDLRDGKITFMDITAVDIVDRSQNIILDSAVELVGTAKQPWYQVTDSLSFLVFYQIATLSRNPASDNFRMLSFAASPTNTKRLTAIGFVETGQVMPDYGYHLCEFAHKRIPPTDFDTEEKQSILSFLAHRYKRLRTTNLGTNAKRQAIARLLRTYQAIVKVSKTDSAA